MDYIDDIVKKLKAIRKERGNIPAVGDHGDLEITVLEEEGVFDTCVHIG